MTAETTRAAADAELDSAVVAAHRDLAGLAVLLDDEALAEFIGAPGARGDRLRLKPASSARLSVVDAAGRWSIVHAFAPAAWAKAVKDIANVGPAGRSSVVIDERRRLVATPATDDRRLVSLDAWRPDSQKWPRRAAFEGLRPLGIRGSRSGRRALRVRTLAHNPSRRWVGVVLSAGEPVAVVKVFARSTDARRAPSMAAAIGAGGVVPRHATAPALRNTHVMSWVDGRHADPTGDAGI
ncbi:MAG: hypothetical protein M3487_08200, partial [Actinomycetota bacterium]|nr:hypothetical protein [Actinomycetota bacterium]